MHVRTQTRHSGAVDSSRDRAALSSLASSLEELTASVTRVAEHYRAGPDTAVASELFSVERSLIAARRSLERARRDLAELI